MADFNERKKAVKDSKRYIETHLYDDFTSEQLAALMNLSQMSLRRYFREIGRYSVHEYVRLRRVHMAARYLRHGGDVETAYLGSGFKSKSGFAKAFTEIFGVTPWEFARTKGMDLMTEPTIMNRQAFTIVGYIFEGTAPINWEDDGAFFIVQEFPEVSPREWARIGGGYDMIGTWVEKEGHHYYIFGPGVKSVRYVPPPLDTLDVPGGRFAVFPVNKPEDPLDSTVICENVQTTWFYALNQWLPDSDYLLDETRIPYEYYLDGNNLVCVPVVPKIKPQRRSRSKKN